ncbi:MAG: ExbD/TolR family protein [Candidatus Aminicenantes bacterium]|nr:ExbD/TolR family protein [Candidatus Aminicenantes bacterium]MBL7082831.1 ExbD/TolR family protein [Candidatus Aminicenantes bacterium]
MALKTNPLRKRQLGTSLSEINVTPFVDVMLVLLVIFMVTAPMMQSGIGVNLPQAETESAPAEEGLTLTITKDKYIHMENSVINQFLLEQKLKEYFYGKEKRIVFIRGDESIPYGFLMRILDITKKAGVETVGLVTQPIEPEEKKRK